MRSWSCLLLLVLFTVNNRAQPAGSSLVTDEALGLRLPRGFRVTVFSDETLANDIYAMTLDRRGQVVVTGPGYISTLVDTNRDGRADEARLFAPTRTGGMGLCFDGKDLYFTGDGFLSRFRDADGDGRADGPAEKILPAAMLEHGGHSLRKGPDGWWHFIGGNDTGFSSNTATLASSPIRSPEAGAIVRFTPDFQGREIIADGLRNPYDFDFNPQGDMFTYDSDVESDFFLPWYTPTRLFHIGFGGHHGWRLTGWQRSWNRPSYYADTIDILAPIGRGSPTGVTCYRHTQFPPHYRNGLFICDWTFGKIFFCSLRLDGASYRSEPEIFLEPTGTHGFAPTDIAVAPDGSLFVSIGGRKTRGAVYRIQYVAGVANTRTELSDALREVLNAPQPLDAWSRERWAPLAKKLGAETFWKAAVEEARPIPERIRAIEVLTEFFGGLPPARALALSQSPSPQIRARTAWSLGRAPTPDFVFVLLPLAQNGHPLVRRCALEAISDRFAEIDSNELIRPIATGLLFREKRVRLAAAQLAARLPDPLWQKVRPDLQKGGSQGLLSQALVVLWRRQPGTAFSSEALSLAGTVLERSDDVELRLQAVRLALLALGDWRLRQPSVEVYTAYESALPWAGAPPAKERLLRALRRGFPTGEEKLDIETSRMLAVLQDPAPETLLKTASFFRPGSFPTSDFHYLTVLSRLRAPWPAGLSSNVAQVILNLDKKLQGLQHRPKQNWNLRLAEVVGALAQWNPNVAGDLLASPEFPTANRIPLVAGLGPRYRQAAARLYLAAVQRDPKFVWSGELIELLGSLPPEQVIPLFRNQWANLGLREALLEHLAAHPAPVDRPKFLWGLESTQPNLRKRALAALHELPPGRDPETALVSAKLLQHLINGTESATNRLEVIRLIEREAGRSFPHNEPRGGPEKLREFYSGVFVALDQLHPGLLKKLRGDEADEWQKWSAVLRNAPWNDGNPQRGAEFFRVRGCQTCHAGPNPLGPDLSGVASRFSTDDLFAAIIFPSRDVAPLYQTTNFRLRNGESYTGVVAFDSADGVILQTGATSTVRISESDIVSKKPSGLSLMPSGLLEGAKPEDLADLYQFLKSLEAKNR